MTFVGQTSDEQGTSEEEMESFRTARPSSLLGRFVWPEEVTAIVPSYAVRYSAKNSADFAPTCVR